MKITLLRFVTPYSLVHIYQIWRGNLLSSLQRSTLKMVAVGSDDELINIYQTTQHHIPQDSDLRKRRISEIL
jgi:hypothetical protein